MAEVFLGLRRARGGIQRLVVVKRLYPHLAQQRGAVKRFVNEARTMSALTHPNIVRVLDLLKEDRGYAIVLEYLSGESVKFILDRCREGQAELPIPIACQIVSEVAHALHYGHQAEQRDGSGALNLVHRDVSPANVIVTYEGTVKVIDFGMSKTDHESHYTDIGTVKGSQAYLSPEAVNGEKLDARSDVFSLGAVLFEMLTGRMAFPATNMAAQLDQILRAEVPPPSQLNPQVSPLVDQVVLDAMARDRDQRIRSAAVLRDRLHHALSRLDMRSNQRQIAGWMTTAFPDALQARRSLEHEVLREGSLEFQDRSFVEHTPTAASVSVAARPVAEPWLAELGRLWWLLVLILIAAVALAFFAGRAFGAPTFLGAT